MTFDELIKKLNESDNEILKNNSKKIEYWHKMKHIKEHLEVFLNHNIAEIEFLNSSNKKIKAIVCSNTSLISIFREKSVKKIVGGSKTKLNTSAGIKSRNKNEVKTWNLVENKFYTIPLTDWTIINWISIPDNYEEAKAINDVIKNILHKQKTTEKEK